MNAVTSAVNVETVREVIDATADLKIVGRNADLARDYISTIQRQRHEFRYHR